MYICRLKQPVSVAQSDARPTGDQPGADSIPSGFDNILSWALVMKYFLRGLSLSRKSVFGYTDRLNMMLMS